MRYVLNILARIFGRRPKQSPPVPAYHSVTAHATGGESVYLVRAGKRIVVLY